MSTLTDKLPKLEIKLPEVLDLDEAKKPAYAAAGVVDLYVEQVKELPAQAKKVYNARTADLTAKIEAARTERTAQLKAVPAHVKALPTEAKKLRAELTVRVNKAQADATAYYEKLAARGEKLVAQIRKQPSTTAAIAEGKAAVKKAEASATAAKKAVKTAAKAAEDVVEAVEDGVEKLG